MEARRDEMVAIVQQWLNDTYGKYESSGRFNTIEVNGKTGWPTIYALRRALQIELGIEQTSDAFGPTTYSKCPSVNQGSEGNIVYIIQGGLWCKGYSPGGFTGYYGNGTYAAVKNLKADMGFPTASGNMNRDVMRGLLDMSAFTLLPGGREEIREIQQKLNYEYYDFYQICPCNGLYDRDMNKMLMYALQKEEGISASQATGAWGPTTIERCPTLSLGDSNVFVTLIKYAVVCNGYSINTSSSVYDAELEATTKDFANSLLIEKAPNKIGYSIIRSLLSSNGDTSRSAKGCDTSTRLDQEKIETLKKHGYEIVGRYLTNVENGTLDKKMTRSEVELILKNGLSIFPIFQEYGASNSAFNQEQGYIQAKKAIQAASNLGIPEETTIYFAVDYDPQESEIINYVYPYFQGINLYFAQSNKEYNIGVYGTRNVCRILKQYESSAFRIDNLFVSDASYGFSGNLGFTMPDEWAFDQFATDITIGEGTGKISIDKVAISGIDKGFNSLSQSTQIEQVYKSLVKIENLARTYLEHKGNDATALAVNSLTLQYLRKLGGYGEEYTPTQIADFTSVLEQINLKISRAQTEQEKHEILDTFIAQYELKRSSKNNFLWWATAGPIDGDFCKLVNSELTDLTLDFIDPVTSLNYDFYHMAATAHGIDYNSPVPGYEKEIDLFSGWGGDLTTFAADVYKGTEGSTDTVILKSFASSRICNPQYDTSFGLEDYISDIDAVNIGLLLRRNYFSALFQDYFITNAKINCFTRSTLYIKNNFYGDINQFYNLCDEVNRGYFPYNKFREILNGKASEDYTPPQQIHYDAANEAFKDFVTNEVKNNR
ncbi:MULTISPECIES: glycoside hydrolase domain-containing protein [Bacillota]|uniref:glycoside hydrolase domain-containing protein n=3 Tax=Bacillota TaxID=1239 RepID=UPI00242E357B|nr:glycoside hydrolase domain-containing protein [Intestinibacter bartlettii]MEE0427736.1 DUF1906 domain-containing protein [Turicibacter sp.]